MGYWYVGRDEEHIGDMPGKSIAQNPRQTFHSAESSDLVYPTIYSYIVEREQSTFRKFLTRWKCENLYRIVELLCGCGLVETTDFLNDVAEMKVESEASK